MPALGKGIGDGSDTIREEQASAVGTSRRHFLVGAGSLLAGGAVLGACGSSSGRLTTTTAAPAGSSTTSPSSGSSLSTSDAGSLAVDASIENLAVFAYEAGIKAATEGKLGKVPPAVPVLAETALSHHKA